jgi:hypothetical protein
LRADRGVRLHPSSLLSQGSSLTGILILLISAFQPFSISAFSSSPLGRRNSSMAENPHFKELLQCSNAAGAEYLIVGGYAVMKYGEPRFTKDLGNKSLAWPFR